MCAKLTKEFEEWGEIICTMIIGLVGGSMIAALMVIVFDL